jgi:hypothetical protein
LNFSTIFKCPQAGVCGHNYFSIKWNPAAYYPSRYLLIIKMVLETALLNAIIEIIKISTAIS